MSKNIKNPNNLTFLENITISSLSCMLCETLTIPFDTVKVLMFLPTPENQTSRYTGLLKTLKIVCNEMGPRFLFKGLEAGLYRQLVFGGIRLGL
mmetsp:Transcript_23496/g.52264  ORF Transcript_23496/g.52264 Transcript_23496/m.52264 type:complete len:94 (+) Transcript_23496:6-287(+)